MPFSLCCSTHGTALCNDRQGAYRTKSLESIDYMEGGKQVKLMDPNMLRYGGSASCWQRDTLPHTARDEQPDSQR